MSQTGRSRTIAAQRHRRGLARAIAETKVEDWRERTGKRNAGNRGKVWARGVERGELDFDVHRAREYAETLVKLEVEQAVFEDWTRARGKGPENREPGAFVESTTWANSCNGCEGLGYYRVEFEGACADCDGTGDQRGGWPGKLAREYAREMVQCGECDGGLVDCPCCDGEVAVRCKVCFEARKRMRQAPMGRSLARVGRRLLEALEGQPSECQGCTGRTFVIQEHAAEPEANSGTNFPVPCPDCHGTGHDLAGVLPPLVWSPAVRRKVCEQHVRARDRRQLER